MADRLVAHIVVEMLVGLADRLEVPLSELCEALPVDEAKLRGRLRGLEWEHFATLMERLEARVGKAAFLEGCAAVPELSPISRRLLSRFVSVRALMGFTCRWMGPGMYPMYTTTFEETPQPDGAVLFHVILQLNDGFRGSRPVFDAHGPATSVLPCFIGHPALGLRAVTTERSGEYWFTP